MGWVTSREFRLGMVTIFKSGTRGQRPFVSLGCVSLGCVLLGLSGGISETAQKHQINSDWPLPDREIFGIPARALGVRQRPGTVDVVRASMASEQGQAFGLE